MKRMYVTLIIIFSVLFWAISGFGLPSDSLQRRMELREEMHRRMMQQLFSDKAPDEDLFKDMEQMFNDSMIDTFNIAPQENFKLEWQENAQGRILAITPQSPEQKLDINVQKGVISIKGQREQKSAAGSSFSSFSNSFPVPDDCDGSKVKIDQNDGKILIQMPFKTAVKNITPPMRDERRPLPASADDVTI